MLTILCFHCGGGIAPSPHAPSRFFNLGDCHGTAKQSRTPVSSHTLKLGQPNLFPAFVWFKAVLTFKFRQLFQCRVADYTLFSLWGRRCAPAPPPTFLVYTLATGQLCTKTIIFFALTEPQRWMIRPSSLSCDNATKRFQGFSFYLRC